MTEYKNTDISLRSKKRVIFRTLYSPSML